MQSRSRFCISDTTAKSFHRGLKDAVGDLSDRFDHKCGIECDDTVDTNPAWRRQAAAHEIGRMKRNSMLGLRARGHWQCNKIASSPRLCIIPDLIFGIIPNRRQRGRLRIHQVAPFCALASFADITDEIQHFARRLLGQRLGLFKNQFGNRHFCFRLDCRLPQVIPGDKSACVPGRDALVPLRAYERSLIRRISK
jgi:hypothetical protein